VHSLLPPGCLTVVFPVVVKLPPTNALPDKVRLDAMMLPVTVKPLKLPRLVMLFSVPALSMPLKVPPTIVPGTVKLPTNPVIVLNAADVTLPVTVMLPPIVAFVVTARLFAVVLPVVVKLPPIDCVCCNS
jgi:hypothetical protein